MNFEGFGMNFVSRPCKNPEELRLEESKDLLSTGVDNSVAVVVCVYDVVVGCCGSGEGRLAVEVDDQFSWPGWIRWLAKHRTTHSRVGCAFAAILVNIGHTCLEAPIGVKKIAKDSNPLGTIG